MMWKVLERWKGTFCFLWNELNAASVAPAYGHCNRKGFMEYWQINVQGVGCVRAGGWRARRRGLGHGNPGHVGGSTEHENRTAWRWCRRTRRCRVWQWSKDEPKKKKYEFVTFTNCFNLCFTKEMKLSGKKSLLLISNSLKVESGKLFRIRGI